VPLSHGHFFVQLETATEVMESLAPLITAAAAAKTPVPDLVPGAPVVGLFNTDKQYYRGRVVEVLKEGVAKVGRSASARVPLICYSLARQYEWILVHRLLSSAYLSLLPR
jgi:hypothetical protein